MHLGDYLYHLSFARGSLMELETHVFLGERLGFLQSSQSKRVLDRSEEVSRMLAVLIKRLSHRTSNMRT
jgi:four helix bundle protein